MKKHKIFSMAMTLAVGIGTLSGCSSNEMIELERVDVDVLATASKSEIPPIVFSEGNAPEVSDSASNDNSSINTEIKISTSSDYYSAVAEPMKFDAEKVKSIFFGNADVIDNTINRPDGDPIYIWKYEDKELSFINDEAILDYTSNLATSINIIFGPPIQGHKGNAHLFEHRNDDLDFCTKDEAIKAVSDTLSKLGISVYNEATIYSLHQSDMQDVVDAECAKGNFYQFDEEWRRIPVSSYTVQKNQECYYIVFNADWNGIPIYNGDLYYKTIKDLVIFQPKISAIYSAEGLIELRVEQYHSITKQGERISKLISSKAAAQVVGEKYRDVVGIEKISFDKMSLMYVLTPYTENGKINSSKVTLTPAWVCTVAMTEYTYDRATGTKASVTSYKDIFIDAQTGVEII